MPAKNKNNRQGNGQGNGVVVIIVAAGRGTRLSEQAGSDNKLPKQYLDLGGKSVLQRTIDAFTGCNAVDHIQMVIHKDDRDFYHSAVDEHPKLLEPAIGGANRQQSVCRGLEALEKIAPEKVLIHDAARPFVPKVLIKAVIGAIAPGCGVLPGFGLTDTVKRANKNKMVSQTLPREELFAAQTPQGFIYDEILAAHRRAVAEAVNGLTDDASIAEWAGIEVAIIDGAQENRKITTLHDLEAARRKIGTSDMNPIDVRTGNGYDVHRLIDGDGITLCGVKIPFDKKLEGHSDADVGLHALTDAILGTFSGGDIGTHFPPSEPKWKGACSDQFLAHAVTLAQEQGGKITNLDVTLVCEAPKIGPHRQSMLEFIARICQIEPFRVSVKATTNEKIGFIGRAEGIAAIATATLVF